MVNGIRSIRTKTDQSNDIQHNIKASNLWKLEFLIIMIIVLVLTIAFFSAMLYEIWVIERNKVEILTLYSYLHFQEIKDVYSACDQYMSNLNRGSLLQDLQLD